MAPHTRPNMPDQSAQAYLRGFFDNLPVGVLIADNDARYVDANRLACELLGRPLEAIVGAHVSDIVAPGRVAEVDVQWQAFLRDGSQSGLFTIVTGDGTPRQIEFQARANFVRGLHCAFVRSAPSEIESSGSGRSVLTLCAWTKRVLQGDEWIDIEEYLMKEHGLMVTHSISPEAFAKVLKPRVP